MAKKAVNLEGPPGTGKSRKLTKLFLSGAAEYGPTKVGAITFTRSAAEVLRLRAGAALHMSKRQDVLKSALPYVGTVHSICYGLLGRPKLVNGEALKSFCDWMNMPAVVGIPKEVDDVDGFWFPQDTGSIDRPGVGMMLKVLSASRHRGVPIEHVVPQLVPPTLIGMYRPEWFKALADKYTDWKRDMKLMDYDDLLESGKRLRIPVKMLLADEVQDNSKLLWEVIDAWALPVDVAVFAGDPYQAIYRFSGADPALFLDHPGEWAYLSQSYRLDGASALYSHSVLRAGGWDLGAKKPVEGREGIGTELVRRDGSVLYLARTHALLDLVAKELVERGEPFTEIRGYSLYTSTSANAYRAVNSLLSGEAVSSGSLKAIVKGTAPGSLSREFKARVDQLTRRERPVFLDDLRGVWPRSFAYRGSEVGDYMDKIKARYGVSGLTSKPTTQIGTIHAAKGMEADHVVLIEDWGMLPSKAAMSHGDGSKGEACVAYVGVTRHRYSLTLRPLNETPTYRFPPKVLAVDRPQALVDPIEPTQAAIRSVPTGGEM